MAERDDDSEMPSGYGLSDDQLSKRRYVPMKGFKGSAEREPDEFDQPILRRFFGMDPFPWALAACVLVWVGLGLASRTSPVFCGLLIAAGFVVMLMAQVWLYVSIFQDDLQSGVWSLISGWYRLLYLYLNPDLTWRPGLLTAVGVLMSFTGMGMLMTQPWAH